MPYTIVPSDGKFCIYLEGEDGKPKGETIGCQSTHAAAANQIAALMADERYPRKEVKKEATQPQTTDLFAEIDGIVAKDSELPVEEPLLEVPSVVEDPQPAWDTLAQMCGVFASKLGYEVMVSRSGEKATLSISLPSDGTFAIPVRSASLIPNRFVVVDEGGSVAEVLDSSPARAYLLKEAGQCPCLETPDAVKEAWSSAEINNLPDSSFLYIEEGGEKDDEGRTAPRSLRHLPVRNASGDVDLPHLRNAIARLSQEATGSGEDGWLSSDLRASLLRKAQALLKDSSKVTSDPAEDTREGEDDETCKCTECGYEAPHKGGAPCVEKYCPECGGKMMNGKRAPAQAEEEEDEVVESGQRKQHSFADAIRKVGEYAAKMFGVTVASKDRNDEEMEHILEIVRSFNGGEPIFFTVKSGADYRWVSISSSHYQDRDEEIVARSALEKDVAERPQDRGPLLFWHEKGVELGTCDYGVVIDGCLVESGVWSNSKLGVAARKAIAARAEYYGLSIGFKAYVPDIEEDKDVNGKRVKAVYNTIAITERSVLPKEWASNLFTDIHTKGLTMDPRKVKELEALIGTDLASAVISQVTAKNTEAAASGVVSKDAKPSVKDVIVKALEDAGLTEEAAAVKAAKQDPPMMKPEDEKKPEEEEEDKKKKESSGADDILKQLLQQMVEQQKAVMERMDTLEAAQSTRAGLVRPSTDPATVSKDVQEPVKKQSGGDVILDSMSNAILTKVLGGGV